MFFCFIKKCDKIFVIVFIRFKQGKKTPSRFDK